MQEDLVDLFVDYFARGPSTLLTYLQALPPGRVADSVASSRWLHDTDVSRWSASEILQFIEAMNLGFLDNIFQAVALAEQALTTVHDAAHFFTAINAAENQQKKSRLKLKFIEAPPIASRSHGSIRRDRNSRNELWAKFFQLDPRDSHRVILQRVRLEDIIELLSLPSGGSSHLLMIYLSHPNSRRRSSPSPLGP